jgi:hypothetical protein
MATPTTKEPHLVSRVVLRAWAGDDGQFVRYDLRSGKSKLSGPDGMGFTRALSLDEAPAFESTWSGFENAWPKARDAVEDGSALGDPAVVAVLRECIAVHIARTHDFLLVHEETIRRAVEESAGSIAENPEVAAIYRERYGEDAAGEEELRDLARGLLEEAASEVEASSFTADSIVEAYEEARRIVENKGIEIYQASDGEFLIGDAPAQTVGDTLEELGPLEGVSWSQARSVLMPITRRHTIALGPDNCLMTVAREDIDRLNAAQIRAAHAHVAWHPAAGFESFAAAERAKRPPRRMPAFPTDTSFDITLLSKDSPA